MFKEYKTIITNNWSEDGFTWTEDPIGRTLTRAAKDGWQFVAITNNNHGTFSILVGRTSISTVLFKKDI